MREVDCVAEGGGAGDGGRGREVAAVDAAPSANKSVDELIDVASVCSRRGSCWGLTQAYSQLKVITLRMMLRTSDALRSASARCRSARALRNSASFARFASISCLRLSMLVVCQ